MSSRRRATSQPSAATLQSVAQSGRAPRASLALAQSTTPTPALPQPAFASRRKWRQSILDGGTLALKMEDRIELVRTPAMMALRALLDVKMGKQLDVHVVRQFTAFEGMKEAYLSPSQFLSASDLPIAFPDSLLRDPLSSLNTLIKLSNMTTFLYLLLSSTPDAQGNRPARSSVWLKQAADHFLTHVVPVDSAIHDGILKMLVHLKCQAYLAAASRSRTIVDTKDYFTSPLSSHLSGSSRSNDPLANRESAERFKRYCTTQRELVKKTGGDRRVLEAHWDWDEMSGEWMAYCLMETEKFEEPETQGEEIEVEMKRIRNGEEEEEVEEENSEEEAGEVEDVEESEEEAEVGDLGEVEDEADVVKEEEQETYTAVESMSTQQVLRARELAELAMESDTEPEDEGEEDEDQQVLRARQLAELAKETDNEPEVEEEEDEEEVPFVVDTQEKTNAAALKELSKLLGSEDEDREAPTQVAINNAAQLQALLDEISDSDDDEVSVERTDVPNRAAELANLQMSDSASDDDAIVAFSKPVARVTRGRPAPVTVEEVVAVPPKMVVRMRDGRLARVPDDGLRTGRLLERQADAERIEWDTQEFEKAPTPNFTPPPPKRVLAPKVPRGSLSRPAGRPVRATRSASASLPPAELPRTRGRQLEDSAVGDTAIEEEEDVEDGEEEEERPIFITEELPQQDYGGGEQSEEEDPVLETVLQSSPILEDAPRFGPSQSFSFPPPTQQEKDEIQAFARAVAPRKVATPVAGPSRQRVQAPVDLDGGFETQSDDSDMDVIVQARQKKVRQREVESEDSDSDAPPRRKIASSGRRRRSSPPVEMDLPINVYRQGRNGTGNRIPWTEKEDDVLLSEMGNWGMQWRKIIDRHGNNGTISQKLKHRNNVSLKDRAVTLKCQALVARRAPPACLKDVTVPINRMPKGLRASQTATPSSSE